MDNKQETKKQIILFGASLDPIHIGHLGFVSVLVKKNPNAKIIVLPSKNRLKSAEWISIEDRIESAKLAFSETPQVEVVNWALTDDVSSTYEVTEKMQLRNPGADIFISAGADVIQTLPMWKNFSKLITEKKWIILTRNSVLSKYCEEDWIKDFLKNVTILDYKSPCSSTAIREDRLLDLIPQKARIYLKQKGYF